MATDTLNQPDTIRSAVRERYGSLARKDDEAGQEESSCCSPASRESRGVLRRHGDDRRLFDRPGLLGGRTGCRPGRLEPRPRLRQPDRGRQAATRRVVLDLGSGAGFDCFLAAAEVGATGKVIGVDMTSDMLLKARRNAEKGNYANVEFRLGEIEHLPLADASVDVIISNCVINLSPDKPQLFREAFRVLEIRRSALHFRRGHGDPALRGSPAELDLHCGCLAGASVVDELRKAIEAAGFSAVRIQPKDESREFIKEWAPGLQLEEVIVSALIEAEKM